MNPPPLLLTADRPLDGTGPASPQPPAPRVPPPPLYGGPGPAPLQGPAVRAPGGQIEAAHPGRGAPAGPAERFDFPGCTILPGLIDTHVHLVFNAADTNEAVIEQVG